MLLKCLLLWSTFNSKFDIVKNSLLIISFVQSTNFVQNIDFFSLDEMCLYGNLDACLVLVVLDEQITVEQNLKQGLKIFDCILVTLA